MDHFHPFDPLSTDKELKFVDNDRLIYLSVEDKLKLKSLPYVKYLYQHDKRSHLNLLILEICQALKEKSFEEIYQALSQIREAEISLNCSTKPWLTREIYTAEVLKSLPTSSMAHLASIKEVYIDRLLYRMEARGIECKRCKQKTAFTFDIQKSSGDEPMRTIVRCVNPNCLAQY